jgi:Grx4 family monothiol glutaredoxin
MSSILSALTPSYTSSQLRILSLDAEAYPDTSEKYDVAAVPFLVFLSRDGAKVLETYSGCDGARVREVVERRAGKPSAGGTNGEKKEIPPALIATAPASNGVSKDLSNYAPPVEEKRAETKEELNQRLAGLVKASPVMLFLKGTPSAPECGFSRTLVGLLRGKRVRYGFFNILADDSVRQGLKEWADWPTFPQLWVDGELVGGLDIVSLSEAVIMLSYADNLNQVKEEWENDEDFLMQYREIPKTNGTVAAA